MPYIVAEPLPSNLLEWHYVVRYRLNCSVGGWYKRAFLYGFQSPGALRTVYTRVGYIMASWSSPQVRERRLCKFISRLTIVSFLRVPLQATLNIHDHPKWQVTRSECCVIERGILFMFFPWEGLRQTPDCASPSLTTTLTPGTQPGL